ncbi:MAG: extracellular solute-binding protein [Lachnospiraceae bacterium]|nr:extracellular solute-binding protein [Lachnospiraceae bacterium]
MIEKMIQNNLLLPVDFSKIPNYKNCSKKWIELLKDIKGDQYAVPYMSGSVGILYNKTLLDEKGLPYPEKWADLWNPCYEGEILMQNSVRDSMMVALKKNGFSMNSKSDKELEIAIYDLLEQKPLVQAYVVDQVRDKMIAGEAMVALLYSGEVIYISDESSNYEYRYVMPEEGTNVWLDGWVISKNSQNVENAHKWLDFMCRPDVAKKNAEFITYESTNDEALKIIDDEYKLNDKIVINNSSDEKNELYHYLGDEVDEMYNEKWKRLKAE